VAVTSCDTSELTSITEPPVAPLLELLAIDTTGVVGATVLVATVVVGAAVVVPMVLMLSPGDPREVAARQREMTRARTLRFSPRRHPKR